MFQEIKVRARSNDTGTTFFTEGCTLEVVHSRGGYSVHGSIGIVGEGSGAQK